jgi:hypothetical protein
MTQIIGLITEKYVLLTSDRMVTYQNEHGDVELRDDKTCKLVNFENKAGIAHSGLAELGGYPTNEWIGKTLAENNCREVSQAVATLKERASILLKDIDIKFRSIEFVVAGWSPVDNNPGLRPTLTRISNCYDGKGQILNVPKEELEVKTLALKNGRSFLFMEGGLELTDLRRTRFNSEVAEILDRQGPAMEVLNTMNQEIIRTSITQEVKTVGSSILSMCLPRAAAIMAGLNGKPFFLATEPTDLYASFYYFENGYSKTVQYGATFVSNGCALTDIVVQDIPEEQFQHTQIKILHAGKDGGFGFALRYSNDKSKKI